MTVVTDYSKTGLVDSTRLPKSYLGVIASRGAVPSSFASGNKQSMSRSKHIAMDNIVSLQLVFANFYVNNGTPFEYTPGAAASYTASIEYPVGTLTIVRFSGSTTGTVADGGTLVSDATGVTIPRGAAFYVRAWQSNSAGIIYNGDYGLNVGTGAVPPSGETWTFGVTTTDLTQSTSTFNNLGAGVSFRPTAIIGYTTRNTFFIAGDSRQSNGAQLELSTNSYGGSGETGKALIKSFATLNAGCSGDTMANAASGFYTKRLPLAAYCSHIICGYGINDFITGVSAATTIANLTTFANRFSGKPVYQTTISPYSASTDSWATTVNQTTNATANGPRVTFNNAVRAGMVAPIVGCIEVADQLESSRDSGLWKVTGGANGYTSDGLHANAAGTALIEVSSAFQNIALA